MDQKKTLCILTDYMIVGGVEKVLIEALNVLHSEYAVTIITLSGGVAPEIREAIGDRAQIRCLGPISRLDHMMLLVPYLGGHVLRKLVGTTYDIVVSIKYLMASFGALGKKSVYWNHGDKDIMYAEPHKLSRKRKINRFRLMPGYKKYDAVWVLSDYIAERLEQAFHLDNLHVLANPIDSDAIIRSSREPIDMSVFAEDMVNLVCVGRLSEEKAQMRLIHAVEQACASKPCRLVLVGDGPMRSQLEQYVSEHHLENDIVFANQQINPYPYIRHADLLVLPSEQESFGLTLLEAMILKTPVLTTATTGGRILTENGAYGILVDNTTEALCTGIADYLSGKILPADTEAAFRKAMTYDKEAFGSRLLALLNEL